MKSSSCCNFSDLEGVSIFPDKVNSDTLKEMGIYPIYDKDEILRGTGFFVKKNFITAAHITNHKSVLPLSIKIDQEYYKLPNVNSRNAQYKEPQKYKTKGPVDVFDLVYYPLNIKGTASLELETSDLIVGDEVSKFGYGNCCGDGISADYETKLLISGSINPIIIINPEHKIIAQNCYEFTSKSRYNVILPSNSGSPLIKDNKVYGMVIRSYQNNEMVGHAIKASYIKRFIEETSFLL